MMDKLVDGYDSISQRRLASNSSPKVNLRLLLIRLLAATLVPLLSKWRGYSTSWRGYSIKLQDKFMHKMLQPNPNQDLHLVRIFAKVNLSIFTSFIYCRQLPWLLHCSILEDIQSNFKTGWWIQFCIPTKICIECECSHRYTRGCLLRIEGATPDILFLLERLVLVRRLSLQSRYGERLCGSGCPDGRTPDAGVRQTLRRRSLSHSNLSSLLADDARATHPPPPHHRAVHFHSASAICGHHDHATPLTSSVTALVQHTSPLPDQATPFPFMITSCPSTSVSSGKFI